MCRGVCWHSCCCCCLAVLAACQQGVSLCQNHYYVHNNHHHSCHAYAPAVQVEVLDADSREPLPFYKSLGIAPAVQLPLNGQQQALLGVGCLAPPSLTGGLLGPGDATGAGSLAAAAAAAGVAGVKLAGREGAPEGGDAAAAAAGGWLTLLSSAAEKGGLAAVNLLGNSRVDIDGPAGAQQQQQQQSEQQQSGQQPSEQPGQQQEQQGDRPEQQEQEQQQGHRVTVLVEPSPVGGHQGYPCRMLHVVLLLPDKSTYQQG